MPKQRNSLVFSHIIPQSSRVFLYSLGTLWCMSVAGFAIYWLQAGHVVSIPRFVLNSLLVAWNLMLPPYFFWYAAAMRRVDPSVPLPDLRVATVVTKTPSEPWHIVRQTLEAALAQNVPHDVWLLDEVPVPEVHAWCARNKISVCTRNGPPRYNEPTWPRKTRSKEGNLAHFYETVGYDRYNVVVQLDADHAPHNSYLKHMLRPFSDPTIGYVAAPNLGDANIATSWTARARLYGESVINGSLQAGYNTDGAPICIGSHYAIRTKALKDIGGIGPELAEDYTTTVLMQSHGWRGAFAYDAVAHGYGPESFADLIVQDFQWAKSLTRTLIGFLPKHVRNLRVSTLPRFVLSVLWYPLLSISMACGLLLPIIAVASHVPMVKVSYVYFLLFALPPIAIPGLTFMWLRRKEWLRPITMRLFSWETVVFQLARWPWTLAGCLVGMWEMIIGHETSFAVTPKGLKRPTPFMLLVPYLGIIAIAVTALRLFANAGDSTGYHFFLILTVVAYLVVICVIYATEHQSYTRAQIGQRWSTVLAGIALLLFGSLPVASPALSVAFKDLPDVPASTYYATIGKFIGQTETTHTVVSLTDPPATHTWTVAEGEYLWEIAQKYYGNGFRWVDIYHANRTALLLRPGDGTVLYPGDRLALP